MMNRTIFLATATLAAACASVAPSALAAAGQPLAGGRLVSSAWLAAHRTDAGVVILHVGETDGFRAGHIPGARLISLEDVSAPEEGGALDTELLSPAAIVSKLEGLGISDKSTVIVYGGQGLVTAATRTIYALNSVGLGSRVAMLDGGLAAWRAAGNAVTAENARYDRGRLSVRPIAMPVVDAEFVKAHARSPGTVLIDARAGAFYDGVRPSGDMSHQKNGHIPGARNLPYTDVTAADGRMKSPAELAALFKRVGVEPGNHIVVYCHVGMQATAVIFAAREIGIDAKLYDGSFQDWTRRELPVERTRS